MRDTLQGTADCEEGVVNEESNNDIYSRPSPPGGVPRVATSTSTSATSTATRYGVGRLETRNVGLCSVGGASSVKRVSVDSLSGYVGGDLSCLAFEELSNDYSGGECLCL